MTILLFMSKINVVEIKK